jgi:hypothetical protein
MAPSAYGVDPSADLANLAMRIQYTWRLGTAMDSSAATRRPDA